MKGHLKHMLIGGAAILAVLLVAGVDLRQALPWAVLLACPLMMIGMMAMMGRGGMSHGQGMTHGQTPGSSHVAPDAVTATIASGPVTPAQVTVVHAPACHFCEDAQAQLAGLSQRFAIDVRRVELESAEGQALVARHRPALNPLVLLDGEFFSAGRLPRTKLTRRLEAQGHALPSPAAATPTAGAEAGHGL